MEDIRCLDQKFCLTCNNDFLPKYKTQRFCSQYCSNHSPIRAQKIKDSWKTKDVTEHISKIENGFQKKYGVSNISKSPYFKEKYKEVMNEKYGVDNYFQRIDLMENHWMNSLGVKNPQANTEINQRSYQTRKSRYVLSGAVPKIQSEMTCLVKYGANTFFGSEKGRMTLENLKINYGWNDDELEVLAKQKNNSGAFGYNKASKESLKVFIPLYKILRKSGIVNTKYDINVGMSGSTEFFLYDRENYKKYLYDFTLVKHKIIIEFNGIRFHPKTPNDIYWKNIYSSKETVKDLYDKDQKKLEFAISNGYKIFVLWSDESIEHNIKKAIKFIKENVNEY